MVPEVQGERVRLKIAFPNLLTKKEQIYYNRL
jgi:hypothetical protein